MLWAEPGAEVVALAALVALLAVALAHPRRRVEAGVSVAAVGVVLATAIPAGVLDGAEVLDALAELAPVVAFLMAVLVVSHVCDRAGMFAAVAGSLRGGGAQRLLTTAFLTGAVVTAVLSLDATVVLLTPVVVAAARAGGLDHRPGAYACLRMANSASLLLPVSNLTNLLALPSLGLTFAGFAAAMAPALVVVLAVEYVGLRAVFRRRLRGPGTTPTARVPAAWPRVPTAVVAAMLAGFVLTSPLGLDPAWPAAAAALVLVAWGHRRRLLAPAEAAGALHAEFALFVLALGVVVAAVAEGGLGRLVEGLLPTSTSWLSLLTIAALATLLAAVLTNLSAALLVVPLVAPLGDVAVLAALVGLNVGSGLVLTGSLANLLWRRTLRAQGEDAPLGEFHRVAFALTPVSVVAAVTTLHLTSGWLR